MELLYRHPVPKSPGAADNSEAARRFDARCHLALVVRDSAEGLERVRDIVELDRDSHSFGRLPHARACLLASARQMPARAGKSLLGQSECSHDVCERFVAVGLTT